MLLWSRWKYHLSSLVRAFVCFSQYQISHAVSAVAILVPRRTASVAHHIAHHCLPTHRPEESSNAQSNRRHWWNKSTKQKQCCTACTHHLKRFEQQSHPIFLVVQEPEIILWKAVCCNFSPTYTQRRFSAQCEKCQRKLLYMQLALMDGQSHETTICIFVISTLNLVFNILNMMHILHLKHIHRWSSFPVISFLFLQTSEGVTHTHWQSI